MLVSGNHTHLTSKFMESVLKSFRLIILHNSQKYPESDTIFQVYSTAVDTINDLTDKIEYSVFFITGDEDKKLLEKLLPKLERDKPKTTIVIPIQQLDQFSDVLLAFKHISTVTFAIVGELFANDIPADSSRSSHIIHTATTQKRVEFTGNDLISVFPIHADDAVRGLQHLLFSHNTRRRVFFLLYEHPQTIISMIHLLKNTIPDLQVLYDKQLPEYPSIPHHAEIRQKILTKSQLNTYYIDTVYDGFEQSVTQTTYTHTKGITQKSRRKKLLIKKIASRKKLSKSIVSVPIISLLVFFILNTVLIAAGVLLAKQSVTSLQNGEFSKAHTQISYANHCFNITEPVVRFGFSIAQYLPFPTIEESYATFTSGVALSKLAAAEFTKIDTVHSGLNEKELLETLATISYLYFAAQSNPAFERLPYIGQLTNNDTSNVLAASSVLPELLGYSKEKRYLVLFQNSGELRPTGGFIGSVGELVLHKGKTSSFIIQDVYDIDGQLKTHIEPPFVVRRYLQPHLYLRDSNFSLDFQEAATTAASLYQLAGHNKVDGVLSVDYEVLRSIIAAVGPIHLPSYNKTIDADTSFSFIHSTIESTFFPGSSQKKSLLQEVFGQLTLKLQDPKNTIAVAKLLPTLIAEKHVLFSFKDPLVQEIFTAQQFAGSIRKDNENSADTISEYFAINEANIGVNKANMHVARSVSLSQQLSAQSINSTATITLNNTGDEEYKVYLRVVTPLKSVFDNLEIDGREVRTRPAITDPNIYESPNFNLPSEIELIEETFHDKKTFGFITTIPKKTSKSFAVSYSRAHKIPSHAFTFNLSYQTQPGTRGYPFTTTLRYPQNVLLHKTNVGSISNNQLVVQIPSIKTDTTVTAHFNNR